VNLLLDFLDGYKVDVRVLQEGADSYQRSPHITVEAVRRKKPPFLIRKIVKLIARISGESHSVTSQTLKFSNLNDDTHFFNNILELIDWADVIILKYPFYFYYIHSHCQRLSVPIITSAHDMIFKQVRRSALIRCAIKHRELDAYRRSDRVVTVGAADALLLREFGVAAVTIPHPVQFPSFHAPSDRLLRDRLAEVTGIPIERRICLFVGSEFPPNVEAVQQIRNIACDSLRCADLKNVIFVVAGACAPISKSENLCCLGRVDECILNDLYSSADIVIIPLRSGTGSSLKTLEAFGAGKAVVGTTIAFRGYDITDGHQCIVEDDIDRYPQRLSALLQDGDTLRNLGESAAVYADKYDYRSVFKEYFKLIGISPELREPFDAI
jgi:glycosyltransferase involved in cell wall biosynthesis